MKKAGKNQHGFNMVKANQEDRSHFDKVISTSQKCNNTILHSWYNNILNYFSNNDL